MNATPYYWSYIDFSTLITYTTYVTYTYNCDSGAAGEFRSNRWRCFKNFAKFTWKYLGWSLFFTKLQAFRSTALLKKRLLHRYFPVKIEKLLRTPILKNFCERLLLRIDYFIIYWFLQFTTLHIHFCKLLLPY